MQYAVNESYFRDNNDDVEYYTGLSTGISAGQAV